jgi:uncharacterized protein (TIGR02118 family)
MITRFGLAPRKSGLTIPEFQTHWRTAHAAVVKGMAGLKRYWQNHAVLRADGEPLLPWTGFDACAQIDTDSLADLDRAFASPHYLTTVKEDEYRFVDGPRGGYVLCERAVAEGNIDVGGVRLLTFMRLTPLGSAAALSEALRGLGTAPGARGRELFLAGTGGALGGQRFSLFDAVDILWFDDPARAERHVTSADARQRRDSVAHLVRGTERLIAKVNPVI